jgi:hypothetical protein
MSFATRSAAVLGAVVVISLACAGEARADHATEMKAREAFAAGRFEQALDLFAKLYAETLHPVYLRNIARCHQKLREPQKAIDAFKDYLAKNKKISADERTEIQGYIDEMEGLKAEQAKGGTSAAASSGAAPAAPLVPGQGSAAPASSREPPPTSAGTDRARGGPPEWSAPPPSGAPPGATLVSQPANDAEARRPLYAKWWFWTLVGAAVAGGAVAAVALTRSPSSPACPVMTCLH